MWKRLLISAIAAGMLLSSVAVAADVSGKWKAEFTTPDGTPRTNTFTFKVDGDKLTGTMSVEGQDTAIADGKVSGDNLSFTASVDRGGNMIKFTYTGKIKGSEIQFKREGGQGQAREFTAKRAQ